MKMLVMYDEDKQYELIRDMVRARKLLKEDDGFGKYFRETYKSEFKEGNEHLLWAVAYYNVFDIPYDIHKPGYLDPKGEKNYCINLAKVLMLVSKWFPITDETEIRFKVQDRELIFQEFLNSLEDMDYNSSRNFYGSYLKDSDIIKQIREVIRNHEGLSNAVKFLKTHPNYNRKIVLSMLDTKDVVGGDYE